MGSITLAQFKELFPVSFTADRIPARKKLVIMKLQNIWGSRTIKDLKRLVQCLGIPDNNFQLLKVTKGCIAVHWLCPIDMVTALEKATAAAAKSLHAEGVEQISIGGRLVLDFTEPTQGMQTAILSWLQNYSNRGFFVNQLKRNIFRRRFALVIFGAILVEALVRKGHEDVQGLLNPQLFVPSSLVEDGSLIPLDGMLCVPVIIVICYHHHLHFSLFVEMLAVAEHAWNPQHAIQWDMTTILNQARRHKAVDQEDPALSHDLF